MIIKMAWRNLLHNRLSSFLCWTLLSSGVAIISLLLLLQQQLEKQFSGSVENIDMVIGAKGSPLQLMLSAVYHIDAPTGNINYAEAEKWMRHPFVQKAIPLAYGDSYEAFSIVGTTPDYISFYKATLQKGRQIEKDFDVIVGAVAAQKLRLDTGSNFFSTHGNSRHGETHKDKQYKVAGILNASGTVLDHLIISNIESVWSMHQHEKEEVAGHHDDDHHNGEAGEDGNSNREITAVLLQFKTPLANMQLPRIINEQTNMMAALPAIEVNRLFSLFGVGFDTLKKIGWGVVLLSGLSVFVALYNSLKERKYEMALMRTMGAGRIKLLSLVLSEALLLSIAGLVTGLLLSRIAIFFFASGFEKDYNLVFKEAILPLPSEYSLALVTLITGMVAALLPAFKAWFTNISKTLSNG